MILKNSLIFFGLIHLLMLNNSFAQGSRTKFSNEQIVAMTGSYLKKMPGSPDYLGAKVYVDSKLGKTYQIHLQVNRSRENEGLGFAFDTMLGLQPYFKIPPKTFIAVLYSDSRSSPPVICKGDVKCATKHFVEQSINYDEWYNKCINFQKPNSFPDS